MNFLVHVTSSIMWPFHTVHAISYRCPVCNQVSILSHFWPTVLSGVPLVQCIVCRLSVCLSSVTFCIVAKQYVLDKNCLKEWIGNQGQRVEFFGSSTYFYFWCRLYGHRDGCFCVIFARIAQQSVPDGTNGLSSSKPCAFCRIVRSELKMDSGLFVCIKYCESLRLKCC